MSEKSERDVEKVYSIKEFAAKLRRLADALEQGKPFQSRWPENGSTFPQIRPSVSNTNGLTTARRLSSN